MSLIGRIFCDEPASTSSENALQPIGKKDLLEVLATLEPIEEDFPDFDAMLPPLDDDPL